MKKIAAMLPEPPKRDKNGHLICYIDLLDTPCGKIAYQLAKYGFRLGISSRGTGDLYTDENGNESVDPNTYDFTTFDLVLLPAVKDARLTMCESYTPKMTKLKKAITESLNKATPEDRVIMENTLKDLQLDIVDTPDTPDILSSDAAEPVATKEVPSLEAEAPDLVIRDESENMPDNVLIEADQETNQDTVTVQEFVKTLSDFDPTKKIAFKPIQIGGQTYDIYQLVFDDEIDEDELVVEVDYSPAMENDISNTEAADQVDSAADALLK